MELASKVALNTAALLFGRVLVVIGGVVTVTLSSRYLTLNEYGALIVAIAFVGILEVLTDLGVYTVAAREIALSPQDERHIVGNVLGLALSVTVVVAATGWLALQVIYSGPQHELVRKAGTYLIVGMIAAPIGGATRAHFVANQRAYLSAVGEIASVATTAAVMAAAVALKWGFVGIAVAQPVGRAAQAIIATALMRPGIRFSMAAQPAYWRRLLVISLPLGATLIVNFLYFRLDALLLSALRSAQEVAVYGLAYKVIESLIVLPSYFMITLFPEIARMERHSERLRAIMNEALAVIEMVALPVLVLLLIFAGDVVTVIGGKKFAEAGPVLRILAIGLALSFVNGVYGHALVALGRQSSLFRVSALVLGVNVVLNLAAIPLLGVRGAALAVALSEVVALIATRTLYSRNAPPPENRLRWRMLAAAGTMAVALALKAVAPHNAVLLVAAAALACACYLASLMAFRAVPPVVSSQLLLALGRMRRS